MKRLWRLVAPLLLTGLIAGCSGEKAEEPKNPVPPPKKGPSSAAPSGEKDKRMSQPAPPLPPPPRR